MEEASPLGGSFLDVDPAQEKKPSTRKKNIPIILLINILFIILQRRPCSIIFWISKLKIFCILKYKKNFHIQEDLVLLYFGILSSRFFVF